MESNMRDLFAIDQDSSFKEILEKLNRTRFCVVLDKNDMCLGTITDGDLRRALISKSVDSINALNISNINCLKVTDRNDVSFSPGITHIPLVDENNIYLSTIIKPDNFDESYKTALVIMAGGLGSRMGNLTKKIPKPLIHLDEKPLIVHIIEKAKSYGFNDIYIVVNYLGHKIKDYLKDGNEFGVKIKYIDESKKRGTAGSMDANVLKNYDFLLLTNSDVISELDFRSLFGFHCSRQNDFTMAVKQFSIKCEYGVVETEGFSILNFSEKPVRVDYINSGIYILNKNIIKLIEKEEIIDIPELCLRSINKGYKTEIYPFTDDWHDVGNQKKLKEINEIFKNKSN